MKKRDPAIIGPNADPQQNPGSRPNTFELISYCKPHHVPRNPCGAGRVLVVQSRGKSTSIMGDSVCLLCERASGCGERERERGALCFVKGYDWSGALHLYISMCILPDQGRCESARFHPSRK